MTVRAMSSGNVFFNGKTIALPPDITHQISVRAAEIIKTRAPVGPNNSRMRVKPTNKSGQIGVYFPPETRHLIYLDQGIKPRLMTELQGKTIPIRTPGGIIFRKAKNIGSVTLARDENGNMPHFTISWRYPGVQAMNFIQPALQQAVDEWMRRVQDTDVVNMLQRASGPVGEFFSRLEKRR